MTDQDAQSSPTVIGWSWLALLLSFLVLGVCAVSMVLWSPKGAGFGLPPDVWGIVLASYVPNVVVTATALRNRLGGGVRFRKGRAARSNKGDSRITIDEGYVFLLVMAFAGPLCGISVIVLLSAGIAKVEDAPWWVGVAAGGWAFTTAYGVSLLPGEHQSPPSPAHEAQTPPAT
jgi:hypothetical protein